MNETLTSAEVEQAIERSRPTGRPRWWMPAILGVAAASLAVPTLWPERSAGVEAALSLALAAVLGAIMFATWRFGRRLREQSEQLDALAELVQLRRWREAAGCAAALLSRPMISPAARVQALMHWGAVLARQQRLEDAQRVYDHLVDEGGLDRGSTLNLKIARAMLLLREDRLVDADRAITELRKLLGRDHAGAWPAAITLIEMYRDIKTAHAEEALELYDEARPRLAGQLAIRSADGHALAARAAQLLGRHDRAAALWREATLLAPPNELIRRYPETSAVASAHPAATAPAEVAGEWTC